jgi:hypothetical protein
MDATYPGARLGLPAEGRDAVAGRWVRFVAAAVDVGLLWLATEVGPWHNRSLGLLAVALVDLVALPARWGTTAGLAALRLRLIPVIDGVALPEQRGLTVLTAVGRAIMFLVCPPLWLVLELVTPDRDRRTVIDRGTSTAVVRR